VYAVVALTLRSELSYGADELQDRLRELRPARPWTETRALEGRTALPSKRHS